MINVSGEFKELIWNGNRNYLTYADIQLSDGTVLNIDNSHIWDGGFIIDDAVSATNEFQIGSAIINKFKLVLNNIYDDFSDYSFEDAIVTVYIGLELPDGTIEKIRKGTFMVSEPKGQNSALITLECLDNMRKFDKPYTESTLSYPATLGEIVRDACSCCDVTLQSVTFDNDNFVVNKRPNDEAVTFREILSWTAQLAVKFCRCDAYGRVVLGWYNQAALERYDGLDGGFYDKSTPYASGDNADGGSFIPWNTGDNYDGGTFEEQKEFHHIHDIFDMSVATDDVVITGVSVEEVQKDNNSEPVTYLSGSKGYIVSIEKNKFVEYGKGRQISNYIAQKLIGFRFRKASFRHLSDPTMEAGDVAYLTDRKQNTYVVLISSTIFKAGDSQTTESSAQTPLRNSAKRFSESTKNYVDFRNSIKEERTEREKALEELGKRLDSVSGTFTTVQKQADGSRVYYLHNKPVLSESDIVWKMTAEAWGVSTDGGKTWNAGMTVDGDTIVRILQAVGISFDWAKGGTLTLGGRSNGNGVMKVLDASGNLVAALNNSGLELLKGLIKGTSIEVGGENDRSGIICVYNDAGQLESVLNSSGILVYKDNQYIGQIGSSTWNKRPDIKGVRFALEYGADYMSWGSQDTKEDADSGTINVRFIYYANDKLKKRGLHLGAPLYTDNYDIHLGEFVKTHHYSGGMGFEALNGGELYFLAGGKVCLVISDDTFDIGGLPSRIVNCYNNIDLQGYHIQNTSDERLKTNIEEAEYSALEKIKEIGVYSFDWIETGEHEEAGFIAQQLETVDENLVDVNAKDGHYSTKGMKLIPYLVKAVQELSEQVAELREEVSLLKGESKKEKVYAVNAAGQSHADAPVKKKWQPSAYTYDEKLAFAERIRPGTSPGEEITPRPVKLQV